MTRRPRTLRPWGRRLAAAGLWMLCCLGPRGGAPAAAGQDSGQAATTFALPTLSGGTLRLEELRGKVVVIDFWASWCEPCLRELPELEKLHRSQAPRGVVFLAVNLDKERANAADTAKKLGLTLPILLDPEGKIAEKYDPPKMPTSYVLDKTGVVRFVNQGYNGAGDIQRLGKQIDQLNR